MGRKRHTFDEEVKATVEEAEAIVEDLVQYFQEFMPPGHVELTAADVRQVLTALLDPTVDPAEQQAARGAVDYQFQLAEAEREG